ncbi:hypothetical protein [Scytonema sp. NUACC26]
MNIVHQLQGVEFEWDSNKAQSNLDKHGITFEEAEISNILAEIRSETSL